MADAGAFKESLVAVVTDSGVSLTIYNEESVFSKDSISGVFTDGKYLVLLGTEGQELFREKLEPRLKKRLMRFARMGMSGWGRKILLKKNTNGGCRTRRIWSLGQMLF
ncbi:hypothetical protein O7R04_01290 [Bacillus velezensis]|nr:hypothetical protein O7R04_01290 [Bacillus velezensis]